MNLFGRSRTGYEHSADCERSDGSDHGAHWRYLILKNRNAVNQR
jgi:hypothetical protein